jgi:hypothetical protein
MSWDLKGVIEVGGNNVSCLSDNQIQPDEDDFPKPIITKRKGDNSFDKYTAKTNRSLLNKSMTDQDGGYNTIRDNVYFNRFHLKYNE